MASAPSASRASPSTWPTATPRHPTASSSSPTARGTSNTPGTWRRAPRPPIWHSCSSTPPLGCVSSRAATSASPRFSAWTSSSCAPTRWTSSAGTARPISASPTRWRHWPIGSASPRAPSSPSPPSTATTWSHVPTLHPGTTARPCSTRWSRPGPAAGRPSTGCSRGSGARLPVQWVLRQPGGGRSYAGMVNGGPFRVGDPVVVLPQGARTTIRCHRDGRRPPPAGRGRPLGLAAAGRPPRRVAGRPRRGR